MQQKVLKNSPLSAIEYGNHGHSLMAAGLFEEANAAFDRADELNPAMELEHDISSTFILVLTGRHEEAIARAKEWPDGPDRGQVLAKAHYALGQTEAAQAAMERLRARPGGDSALRLAEVEAFRGRTDSAFDWLARIRHRATEAEIKSI